METIKLTDSNTMECYIRKNPETINDREIWEVVQYQTGGVIWWGSDTQLTKRLGRNNWMDGDTIIWK